MATLKKAEMTARVANKLGGSRGQGLAALNAVLDSVREAVADGDQVTLTGFGTFEIRQVRATRIRAIRGDRAGSLITVPAHTRVGFRPGTNLKLR
jgi:nucleoid DNA-binding protein